MIALINAHVDEADRADVISYALDFHELSPAEKSRIQAKFNISEQQIQTYKFAKEAVFSGHDEETLKRLNQIVHLVSD
jgi:hypothetical protein